MIVAARSTAPPRKTVPKSRGSRSPTRLRTTPTNHTNAMVATTMTWSHSTAFRPALSSP
jgi:hypothetical protein